jgi:hypothetical protein
MDMENFHPLLRLITYDDIIDATLEGHIATYITNINQKLNNQGWAFIESPGIEKGYAIEGSGSFIVQD